MAIADYLAKLISLRDRLAHNLTLMGVNASSTETLETLVPKVLQILVGDTSAPVFLCSLTGRFVSETAPTYYFEPGEALPLAGHYSLGGCNLMTAITARWALTGDAGVVLTGAGWVLSAPAEGRLEARYELAQPATFFSADIALEALAFSLTGNGSIKLTISAEDAEGNIYPAEGELTAAVSKDATWAVLEHVYPTWGDISNQTWNEIASKRKVDYA